ncbi:MAG: alpha/beta hydrolase [Planctomycetes bacterium]|nr:alpha/beta hydrolase [Planctomycetota bacterium]
MAAWLDKLFLFHPTRYPDGSWDTRALPLPVEECAFPSKDGVRLHAWHVRNAAAPWTLFFCHGNTGNIGYRLEQLQLLAQRGWDVFIFDYRGYGKSEGEPSEAGLYLDAEAAFDFVVEERKLEPDRLLLFGQSLGGAVAVELATRRAGRALGLVLESTFTRIVDVGRRAYPYAPVGPFFGKKFDSLSKIARIGHPLLSIHGTDDEIIPFELGRALFDAAPEPKWFFRIPGATHKDTFLVSGEPYYRRIEEFVEAARGIRQGLRKRP